MEGGTPFHSDTVIQNRVEDAAPIGAVGNVVPRVYHTTRAWKTLPPPLRRALMSAYVHKKSIKKDPQEEDPNSKMILLVYLKAERKPDQSQILR